MQKTKVVYLVRHGQSEDNAVPVFQAYDSPLSAKGKQQASQLAARLKHIKFEMLLSSPQPRARETADAIAVATHTPVVVSELFEERRKPVSVNGKPWSDEQAATTWRAWNDSLVQPDVRVEDGENREDIFARADQALAYLEHRNEHSFVVVSHGYFIRTLIARALLGDELPPDILQRLYWRTSLENTAITVLRYEDAYEQEYCWRVWTMNDHAHFAE